MLQDYRIERLQGPVTLNFNAAKQQADDFYLTGKILQPGNRGLKTG